MDSKKPLTAIANKIKKAGHKGLLRKKLMAMGLLKDGEPIGPGVIAKGKMRAHGNATLMHELVMAQVFAKARKK